VTRRFAALAAAALLMACGGSAPGDPVEIQVPRGATFSTVVDTLHHRGIVGWPRLFRVYARLRGDDERVKAGRYALAPGRSWSTLLDDLTTGKVVTEPLTIPEGFRLTQIAPRVSALTGLAEDSVLGALGAPGADTVYGVPGPGLEGYLFPDTYLFAAGVPLDTVIRTMTRRYVRTWTPERRARLDSLGLSEQEAMTLASIVQAEARHPEEMPRIASVYLNRLQRGWLLQADPTVLYALGAPRERLLFAAIDSVADDPYNTYTQAGLPPGPIGAPGEAAIDAVLHPAGEPFLYFVAWPDGSHHFSRTLAEHNRAVAEARRERARDGEAASGVR
jgi:UPF0755 protein